MYKSVLMLLVAVLLFGCNEEDYQAELIVGGMPIPWGMAFVDDKNLIVTQKEGKVSMVNIETKLTEAISGAPAIDVIGQGGLMDVALSPNFSNDRVLYFTYAKRIDQEVNGDTQTNYATSLATAKLVNDSLEDWQDLFVSNIQTRGGRHFGSRITFDNAGHVFFSHGDRGEREKAQDLSNHAGTILRLNLDGSIPEDNPFVGQPEAQPEIWSYGHRNPQGLFYDQATDRLWSNEHGPRGGDEINLVEKGINYGWPTISYGKEYVSGRPVGEATEKDGLAQPMKYYDPSIAPASLIVYTGSQFPQWQGSLLSSALVLRHLNIVNIDQDGKELAESRVLKTLLERIRNAVQAPNGDLYIASDAGGIYKLLNDQQE